MSKFVIFENAQIEKKSTKIIFFENGSKNATA